MMRRITFLVAPLALFRPLLALATLTGGPAGAGANPCLAYDALYAQIRDATIGHEAALERIRGLLPRIREYYAARGGREAPAEAWRFPLEGYGDEAIGGTNGSGYRPDGYDYLDGYKSRGHPGHDLFIHDRDENTLDDRTGRPVRVLSMTSGIVVAYSPDWAPGNRLRGGRYVYVYDPGQNGLFYYAHNRELLVKPCDIVTPGQPIAIVGRTGRNAMARRSPTHLHVMFLAFEPDGHPRPRDLYPVLRRLGRRRPGRKR